jgi:hypothetical protein
LTIAQYQFTLASANRDHGIYYQDSGLERDLNRSSVHNARCNALYGSSFTADWFSSVKRPTGSIYHSSQKLFSYRHIHDPSGSAYLLSGFDLNAFVQHDNCDLFWIKVEGDGKLLPGKSDELL